MFPSTACIRWLEIVADSYVRAYARSGEEQATLAERIRSDLGKAYEPSWIPVAARLVRRLLRKSRGSKAEYRLFLSALKRRLSLDDEEEAARLYPLLADYPDTTNEHCNVVVSTAALYDKLFSEFLVRLLESRGEGHADASKEVAKKSRRDDLRALFQKFTGTALHKAVGQFGVRSLYGDWQDVTHRRNEYLHATPEAINRQMAEKAFNAAKNAFGLFSFLHNKYCLVPLPTGEGPSR
jgi:hypothetical protein